MEKYLQFCRGHLSRITTLESIHFVIGNESCDLDSAVSSLVLAYTLHTLKHSEQKGKPIVIPLLNVPRRKLGLRTEITFWLQDAAKISLKSVICKDEINWNDLRSSEKKVIISLVDHNENKEMESTGEIIQIIDHTLRSCYFGYCFLL